MTTPVTLPNSYKNFSVLEQAVKNIDTTLPSERSNLICPKNYEVNSKQDRIHVGQHNVIIALICETWDALHTQLIETKNILIQELKKSESNLITSEQSPNLSEPLNYISNQIKTFKEDSERVYIDIIDKLRQLGQEDRNNALINDNNLKIILGHIKSSEDNRKSDQLELNNALQNTYDKQFKILEKILYQQVPQTPQIQSSEKFNNKCCEEIKEILFNQGVEINSLKRLITNLNISVLPKEKQIDISSNKFYHYE